MKKVFVTPSVRIYTVQVNDIIATSTTVPTDKTGGSGSYSPITAPERDDFDDFE